MTARMLAPASPTAIWILAAVAMLFFLRAASTLLIPIALAVLISYALEPVVAWLVRRRLSRTLASALVLVLVLLSIGGGLYTLRDDAVQLIEAVPEAVERLREGILGRLADDVVQQAGSALGTSTSASGDVSADQAPATSPSIGSLVPRAASALLAGAGHFVVIVFLVFFLLLAGSHVKNRFVEVAAADREQRELIGGVIDEINVQIQRYLLVLLVTAVVVGIATWLVLAALGNQHAAVWGLLAGIFNSIPYFGPVIVSGGLFVVGMAQGGLTTAVQMAGTTLVITSLEGWLLTPPLMGRAERMSALVVFLGLLVWTWLWGAWGTVLAVPMLVIIKSVADHIDRLRPLGRMMAP